MPKISIFSRDELEFNHPVIKRFLIIDNAIIIIGIIITLTLAIRAMTEIPWDTTVDSSKYGGVHMNVILLLPPSVLMLFEIDAIKTDIKNKKSSKSETRTPLSSFIEVFVVLAFAVAAIVGELFFIHTLMSSAGLR